MKFYSTQCKLKIFWNWFLLWKWPHNSKCILYIQLRLTYTYSKYGKPWKIQNSQLYTSNKINLETCLWLLQLTSLKVLIKVPTLQQKSAKLSSNNFKCDLCDTHYNYIRYSTHHLHQRIKEHKLESSAVGRHMKRVYNIKNTDLKNNFTVLKYTSRKGKISVLGCTIVKSYKQNLTQTLTSIVKYTMKLHA